MKSHITAQVEKIEKPFVAWALLGVLCTLALVYMCFVSGAVVHALSVKGMQSDMVLLTSHVGTLESQYLSVKSSLTLDMALAEGYVLPKETTVYLAKNSQAQSLSFNR